MSYLSNCRFLLVSSSNELIAPLQAKLDEIGVLHFEKSLMIKAAKAALSKATNNGHIFQYIIVDQDSGSEDDAFAFYNYMKTLDKFSTSKFIYIKSSVDDGSSGLAIKSSLELQEDSNILFYSKPLDSKLLIKDLENDFPKSYGENAVFIDSIEVDDFIIYKMAPVIDRTLTKQIESLIQRAINTQENTIVFNFKNTIDFPASEMKEISQQLLKAQKEYPFVHTTSFSEKVIGEMRKAGFTQVFDIKTTFKDLVTKYQIDPNELKKAMNSH